MTSPWITHLSENKPDDPYFEIKNSISLSLEEQISNITQTLLKSDQNYDLDTAKKVAVNLVMEQLLGIQYDLTPVSQASMVIALFTKMKEIKPMLESSNKPKFK